MRNETGGGFRGVRRCGNFWVCPDCAAAATHKRFEQVSQVLEGVAREGHQIEFVTLTLAHYKREKLADLLELIQKSWVHLRQRNARDLRGWKYVRALEIKWHWRTGWHVHFHAACWGAERGSVANWIEEEWVSAVRKFGGRASVQGQLVKPVDRVQGCAQYLTKEMTLTISKQGDSFHPFQILGQAANGNATMQAVWSEYEQTLKARRTSWMVFSRGLLPTYVDLDEPLTDERVIGVIPHDSFVQLAEVEKDVIKSILVSSMSDEEAFRAIRSFMSWLNLHFLPPEQANKLHEEHHRRIDRRERPRFGRFDTWPRRGGREEWMKKNKLANSWFAAIEDFYQRSAN